MVVPVIQALAQSQDLEVMLPADKVMQEAQEAMVPATVVVVAELARLEEITLLELVKLWVEMVYNMT